MISSLPTGLPTTVFVALATCFCLIKADTRADTRVGVAATDITPPLGIPMAGYYHERGADGVLDPLFSKAMVIEVDGVRVAFVALDLISVTREITDAVRTLVQATAGIPAEHVTLVANGTCGNLNHLDFSWRWPQGTASEQHRIATILGAAVFQAYKDLEPVAGGPLRVKREIVALDLPEITPGQVEEAKRARETAKDDRGANFMKLVRAYRALDVSGREGKPHRVEVQVIALGNDLAWVSLPGEVFVELGLAIKQRSPFPHTFLVELANENIGYIPDRRSYAEGNYEPESARCAAGSGERLVEVAVKLLNELKPRAEP